MRPIARQGSRGHFVALCCRTQVFRRSPRCTSDASYGLEFASGGNEGRLIVDANGEEFQLRGRHWDRPILCREKTRLSPSSVMVLPTDQQDSSQVAPSPRAIWLPSWACGSRVDLKVEVGCQVCQDGLAFLAARSQ